MKAKAKQNRVRRRRAQESSPLTMLESELRSLHRDLRTIAKAYIARLENDLFVCLAALRSYGPIEKVPREMLHQIRDLTIIVRNRKLKPEKRPSQRLAQNRLADRRLSLDDWTEELSANCQYSGAQVIGSGESGGNVTVLF
jgi:hypothetical protein